MSIRLPVIKAITQPIQEVAYAELDTEAIALRLFSIRQAIHEYTGIPVFDLVWCRVLDDTIRLQHGPRIIGHLEKSRALVNGDFEHGVYRILLTFKPIDDCGENPVTLR